MTYPDDIAAIQALNDRFFDVFTNTNQQKQQVANLWDIFILQGMVINNTRGNPEVYDLESFIAPREKMLTGGTLINFKEKEIRHNTDIYKNMAQRVSQYEKSGELNGQYFETQGVKSRQFVKIEEQ